MPPPPPSTTSNIQRVLDGLDYSRREPLSLLPLALVAVGFGLRLANAAHRFLNADEALHYLLTLHGTVGRTYQASLAVNHPPLLILVLHYWSNRRSSAILRRLRAPRGSTGLIICQ